MAASSSALLDTLRPHADRIVTPALVIDLDAARHNIARVLQRVGMPARWRPHVKTVKQAILVDALLEAGVRRMKCATLDELALVARRATAADAPVELLLAHPIPAPLVRRAIEVALAHPRLRLQLLADRPEHLAALRDATASLPWSPAFFLDVDLGMHRTGAPPETWRVSTTSRDAVQAGCVAGLHGYDGHLRADERAAAHAGYDALGALASGLDLRRAQIVTSGTHSYAHALDYPRFAEADVDHQISPGTVVLSDLRSEPAVHDLDLRQAAFVLSRIVSAPLPDRLTADAGSKGIAPDRPAPGLTVLDHPELLPQIRSEEHLPLQVSGTTTVRPGDLVLLVPEHVCTTVNLYREALWISSGRLVGRGAVDAASRTTWLEDAPA